LTLAAPRGYDRPVFRPEPRISHVPALREQVAALVASINQPLVSVPGKPAQAARGHLCVLRNGNGTLSVYVSFHLESGENVVYVHEPPQLPPAGVEGAQQEGLQLLESMGFILDDLRFANLPAAAQQETLKRVPLFSAPKPARDPAPAPTGPSAALGRFLASF
jgi:hypothetical protein